MIPVDADYKEDALGVLVSAFQDNPGALWVVKQDQNVHERLKVLCSYCLNIAMDKQGAFMTSDSNGAVLIFESERKQHWRTSLLGYIRLGHKCISWPRAWRVIQRERQIVKRRAPIKHLYCWMLAVSNHSNGVATIVELRDFIFQLSEQHKRPILAETTVEKNVKLYQRYGFEMYDTWKISANGPQVYFLRRDP